MNIDPTLSNSLTIQPEGVDDLKTLARIIQAEIDRQEQSGDEQPHTASTEDKPKKKLQAPGIKPFDLEGYQTRVITPAKP